MPVATSCSDVCRIYQFISQSDFGEGFGRIPAPPNTMYKPNEYLCS